MMLLVKIHWSCTEPGHPMLIYRILLSSSQMIIEFMAYCCLRVKYSSPWISGLYANPKCVPSTKPMHFEKWYFSWMRLLISRRSSTSGQNTMSSKRDSTASTALLFQFPVPASQRGHLLHYLLNLTTSATPTNIAQYWNAFSASIHAYQRSGDPSVTVPRNGNTLLEHKKSLRTPCHCTFVQ